LKVAGCQTNTDARIGFRLNVTHSSPASLRAMNKPEQPMMLPLAYVAQIVFELHAMRRECSQFAGHLMRQRPLNEQGLEECARLDDALAHAHGLLRHAVDTIKITTTNGRKTDR
jgi:hypothetical protein